MDITWSQVEAFAPELSTVDADAQTDILAFVNTALDANMFGGTSAARYKLAKIYMAAHFGSQGLRGVSGSAGPVTSEAAGGISRSYGFSGGEDSFETSTYGKMYLALLRTSRARGGMVV